MKIEKFNTTILVRENYNHFPELYAKINELIDAINYLKGFADLKEEKHPELLGCPWCGKKPIIRNFYTSSIKYYAICTNDECIAQPDLDALFNSEQEAISAWNTRHE